MNSTHSRGLVKAFMYNEAMDHRLRLLLRQFQLSGDPEDAVKFANTVLRSGGSGGSGDGDNIINIWVLTMFDNQQGDNEYGSEVVLYFSELHALDQAFDWASEWFDMNEPGLAEQRVIHFELLLKNFEDQLDAKNLDGARNALRQFNEYLPRGVDIDVSELPIN